MVTQVLVVAVQNSVERRELGVATAVTGFFRAARGLALLAVLRLPELPLKAKHG